MTDDAYRTQSIWTDPGVHAAALRAIPPDPDAIVRVLSGLLLHPMIAPMRGIPVPDRAMGDRNVRSVEGILDRVVARDGRDLTEARAPADRGFCVCAGFARVATAVFRMHGTPARCRVGFAAYFNPGFLEDHWVCEYRTDGAWRLLDAQLDEETIRMNGIAFPPTDVPRDQFVVAPTAWRRLRAAEIDAARIGLSPMGFAGGWFVAGNLMLDAAALNKEEMLPWEKWSVGRALGPGATVPADLAERFDAVAAALDGPPPDAATAARVYREQDWLRVTPTVVSFSDGAPTEVPGQPPST
jgi:hypothetical protein